MKRSKILRIIEDTITKDEFKVSGNVDYLLLARSILDNIEEAGMLPPQILDPTSNTIIIFNSWEPEE